MTKGTRTAPLVEGSISEEFVKRAEAAVEAASRAKRVRAGLEAAIETAETDPAAARSALHGLRSDPVALGKLERWLGGEPTRAAFGLGAALQVAIAELASEQPDLRSLTPELLRWLEGDW